MIGQVVMSDRETEVLAAVAADARVAPAPGQVVGLPGWRTTFVGRPAEQAAVTAAMTDSRTVTLVGPGGAGKTQLSERVVEAVAGTFPAGGAFVDLVPARPGSVSEVVAAALGVAADPHRPLDAAIRARLRRGRCLLVLDNCEHVIDEAASLAEQVLTECP